MTIVFLVLGLLAGILVTGLVQSEGGHLVWEPFTSWKKRWTDALEAADNQPDGETAQEIVLRTTALKELLEWYGLRILGLVTLIVLGIVASDFSMLLSFAFTGPAGFGLFLLMAGSQSLNPYRNDTMGKVYRQALRQLLRIEPGLARELLRKVLRRRRSLNEMVMELLPEAPFDTTEVATPYLKYGYAPVRALATREVANRQPDRLLGHMPKMLNDYVTAIRTVGYQLLPKLPYDEARALFLKQLTSGDLERREEALEVLTNHYQQFFTGPDLLNLLRSTWPRLRTAAARILASRPGTELIAPLLERVETEQDPKTLTALLAALAGRDFTPTLLELYLEYVQPGHPEAHRRVAIQALSLWRNRPEAPRVITEFALLLQEQGLSTALRMQVGDALIRMGPTTVPTLIKLAGELPADNRITLYRVLAQMATPEALHELARQRQDPDERIARMAFQAATAVAADDKLEIWRQGLQQQDLTTRERMLEQIARAPDDRVLPLLHECWERWSRFVSRNIHPGAPDYLESEEVRSQLNKLGDVVRDVLRTLPADIGSNPQRVLCMQCHARPQQQTVTNYVYLACRKCHRSKFLKGGVKQVTGVLTAEEVNLRLDAEGQLRLSVWDEMAKQLVPADIDRLEVTTGQPLSYDWAMTALMQRRQEENIDTPLEVVVAGEMPFSGNTLRMMQEAGVQIVRNN